MKASTSTPRTVKLWRNTAMMIFIGACWLFVFIAVAALDRESTLGVAASLVAALVLAIGLLPGSFLQHPLDQGAQLALRSRPSIVVAISLGAPLLFLVYWVSGALAAWDSLQFARRYGLDAGMQTILTPLFVAGALIGLVFFARNLATFFRFRGQARGSTD